jgi:hypothetical protein
MIHPNLPIVGILANIYLNRDGPLAGFDRDADT